MVRPCHAAPCAARGLEAMLPDCCGQVDEAITSSQGSFLPVVDLSAPSSAIACVVF